MNKVLIGIGFLLGLLLLNEDEKGGETHGKLSTVKRNVHRSSDSDIACGECNNDQEFGWNSVTTF